MAAFRTGRPVRQAGVDLNRIHDLVERGRQAAAQYGDSEPGPRGHRNRSWYRISNAASGEPEVEVYIYDEIGMWGISAQDFVADLAERAAGATQINVHISSGGGDVFDGLAMYETLSRHKATVTTYIDSLAASAASFIAQAGDKRVIARNARMMIHDASGFAYSNAAGMREMADLLDDTSDNIASIYAERSGGKIEDFRAAMLGETWYSPSAAVEAGLADEISTPSRADAADGDAETAPAADDRAPVKPAAEIDPFEGIDFTQLAAGITAAFR